MHNLNEILGFRLHAADDQFGSVSDIYFDDRRWGIRYLVVDTGNWLPGRKVLISPAAAGVPDWREKSIPLVLNRVQIESSPSIDADKPVSRQFEEELSRFYGWPRYWAAAGLPAVGIGMMPPGVPLQPVERTDQEHEVLREHTIQPKGDPNLRSFREVKGYYIEATDGPIGHVEGFLADLRKWNVRQLVVDTRNWLPGKNVVVSLEAIAEVNWKTGRVYLSITKGDVEGSPVYSQA